MERFDLGIIGGGPAGYLAAERAAEGGLKVVVFEKRALGGVCLNEGCIPSKAFLNSAKIFHYAAHGEKYGVTTKGAEIDHAVVVKRKNKVVKILVSGVKQKLKKYEVTVVDAQAKITGGKAGSFTVEAGGETYETDKLLVACGSVPVVPPIPGVEEGLEAGTVLTNREILDLTQAPASLVVIGAGVIGLEMACYFNDIGTEVTVVEMLGKCAGPTDEEISGILQKNLEKRGIRFHLNSKVTAVEGGKVTFETSEGTQSVQADKVLLSIGRRVDTEGLGLDALGVATERGAVVTDERLRTNVHGVWAAGDSNGKSMLAHTAYRESEVAVNDMLGREDRMRYDAIPSVIYTNPEVAGVGHTMATAKAAGLDVEEVTVSMRYSGRYLAEVEGGDGICKLVVDRQKNRLVGVHMIGSYTSEIIYGAGMMIETGMEIEDSKKIVFPHPTVCEVIREALFEV
ncbi:dihydrolipoyl dehydrogenase [Ruminococcaceae bacterium OttesenSCG-928-I18]|nr:dihydrolipoyl dehydrogenase [Ruminococcaceae bacterium OttesenSCG-928-I18]